jgi:hypothetical protein
VANELDVGIDDGCSQRLGTSEVFALNRIANGVRMNAQFAGDSSDLPVFDVKVAANLRADFRTDHCDGYLLGGMRGNGSMKRPVRPQNPTAQPQQGLYFLPGPRRRRMLYRIGPSTIE